MRARKALNSGSVYSVEFCELVSARLARGGIFAQRVPTQRVLNSVAHVFPHVSTLAVPGDATFLVASHEPIVFDRAAFLARYAAAMAGLPLPDSQKASLERFFTEVELQPVRSGEPRTKEEWELNRGLHPRDEYFLND